MAGDDLESPAGIARREGDDGAPVAHDKVFSVGTERPGVLFGQLFKPVRGEICARVVCRLVGGIGSFQKLHQFIHLFDRSLFFSYYTALSVKLQAMGRF